MTAKYFYPVFFFLLLSTQQNKAQTKVLSENFETGALPADWLNVPDGSGNAWAIVTGASDAASGSSYLSCSKAFYPGANAWLFTKPLVCNSNTLYRVSYFYRGLNELTNMRVTTGTAASEAGQNILLHNYYEFNSATFAETVDYFRPTVNGTYYFGFNCNTEAYSVGQLQIDSIVIMAYPPCTGLPDVGTASTTTPVICYGDSLTLNISGTYLSWQSSLQWQSAPAGSNSFTDLYSAQTQQYRLAPQTATDYRCRITCLASGQQAYSNTVSTSFNPACYCTPVSVDCSPAYVYLSYVKLEGFDYTSTCSGGYSFLDFLTGKVYNGASMPLLVSCPNTAAVKYVAAWIDYNRNGRFDAAEFSDLGTMPVSSPGLTGGTVKKSIPVPPNAVTGNSRMRVRVSADMPLTAADACKPINGETEDYPVEIASLAACVSAPAAGLITSSAEDSICAGANFTLLVSGSSSSGTYTSYQWQSSSDGVNWNNILNETEELLTTAEMATTWYRRKITCNNGLFSYTPAYKQNMKFYLSCTCVPSPITCGPYISNVTIGAMNNNTSCSGTAYKDYNGIVTVPSMIAGTSNSFSVTAVTNALYYGVAYVKCWIDFNHSGSFEDAELYEIGSTNGTTTFPVNLNVPFDAVAGSTVMRIAVYNNAYFSACLGWGYGNIQDYRINIAASPTPSAHFSIYVKNGGGGNGTSWGSALYSLQQAINVARPYDTIKVAKGIYSPGTARTSAFFMKTNVIVLGGFPDTGNPGGASRNWGINQTILTAENGDPASKYDNCTNVVVADGVNGTAKLDGFIIEGAYGFDDLSYAPYFGGAVTIRNSSGFTLSNCVIRNNLSTRGGSAVYAFGSSPVISNCFIVSNEDYELSPLRFVKNSTPQLINNVIASNSSSGVLYANLSNVSMVHSTIANNILKTFVTGTGLRRAATIRGENAGNIAIGNSIFFNNEVNDPYYVLAVSTDSLDIVTHNSNAVVSSSIMQFDTTGTGLLTGFDPHFFDGSSITGSDNLFYTTDDGLQLTNPCSPGMNTGSALLATGITTDLLGKPRQFASAPDMGAYEIQSTPTSIPAVVYVNAAATGSNNGTSWANAFTSIQAALRSCSGIIKVAAGTYYPSPDNSSSSFVLQKNRELLGGYPATGNPGDALRNPGVYTALLSGNLPNSNKSEIVVRVTRTDSTTVFDGFTITGAQNCGLFISKKASPVIKNITIVNNNTGINILDSSLPAISHCIITNNTAGGAYIENAFPAIDRSSFVRNNGAAMKNTGGMPKVSNCIFRSNFNIDLSTNSHFNGGDLVNNGTAAKFTNCLFTDSLSAGSGGCMYNLGGAKPVFINCEFRNSNAQSWGGVSYSDGASPEFYGCAFLNTTATVGGAFFNNAYSRPLLINCVASGNSATSASFMYNTKSEATVTNTTVVNNSIYYTGVGTNTCVFFNTDSATLSIRNSILWNNSINAQGGPAGVDIKDNSVVSPLVTNNVLQTISYHGKNGNIAGINPRLKDISNPAGPDQKMFTADDGLALCTCSPFINKGTNGPLVNITTDIINNPRLNAGIADIGAYESPLSTPTTQKSFYVAAGASGANNGTTWVNAYKDLRAAVQDACADTLRVAAGIYKIAVASRDSFVNVNHGLVLLAGYPAAGAQNDAARDADLYPAILDGDIGKIGDSTDNSMALMKINAWDTSAIIDGLTFRNANYNGTSHDYGAVIASSNKNLAILNCRFYNNTGGFGSALNSYGPIEVSRCVFTNNRSGWGTYSPAGSGARVSNSVFYKNKSGVGGGVYCGANAVFDNVVFYGNQANAGGGAYLSENPGAVFTNCNFVANSSTSYSGYGSGLLNYNSYLVLYSNPVIRNCIFSSNGYGYQYNDWAWISGSYGAYTPPDKLDIKYSAVNTSVPYDNTCIYSPYLLFTDITNPAGADGKWFTADDGLQLQPCSAGINQGDNTAASRLNTDILQLPRVRNDVVDIGSYEHQSGTDIVLSNANDSLPAVREQKDSTGWTSYYSSCNKLLLAIKTVGQDYIGTTGYNIFDVTVKTTAGYGSGKGFDLSAARYVTPGIGWKSLNKYWSVTPVSQPTDSAFIRLPLSSKDFADLKGSYSSLTSPDQLVLFIVDSTYTALDTSVSILNYHQYVKSNNASTSTWKYVTVDSLAFAEFAVKKISSGSAGFGTGFNNGAIGVANSNGCAGAGRVFTANVSGSSFKWQVNTGSGFVNVVNDANYSGATTATLSLAHPAVGWAGYQYRCLINGTLYTAYNILKFQNKWTGSVNNVWENPGNWSCSIVPDQYTDVVIESGNVIINSNTTIRSLAVQPGVKVTVSSGYTLTVLH